MVQLVHAGQFDLVPKISNLGTGFSQGMQMASQFQEGKQKRLEDTQEQSFLRADIANKVIGELQNVEFEQRGALFESLIPEIEAAGVDIGALGKLDLSNEGLARSLSAIKPLMGRSDISNNANKVGARKIFKNGLVLQSTPKGPRVYTPAGVELTGVEAQQAVDKANEFELKFATDKSQGVAEGKGLGETSVVAEKEFQSLLGKEGGKIYANLQSAAQGASAFIPRLESLRKLASTVTTGTGAEIKLMAKKALGIDSADMEELNAKLGELAQDILNQQTGTKTDFDFQNAVRQSASLGKTPEANARLIEALIARQEQAVRFGDMAKDAMRKGGVQGVLDLRYSAPAKGADVESLINKYAD